MLTGSSVVGYSTRSWCELSCTTEVTPGGRVGHTAHVVSDLESTEPGIILVGGADLSKTRGDIYSLKPIGANYACELIQQDLPELSRYEHASGILKDKRLLIFGGASQSGPLKSSYTLDFSRDPNAGDDEVSCEIVGSNPFPGHERTQHTAVCLTEHDQLLVFAGAGFGSEPVPDTKVYMYDSVLDKWSEVQTTGQPPCPRLGHLLVYQPNSRQPSDNSVGTPIGTLYIHGGMASDLLFDDFHELAFTKEASVAHWKEITVLQDDYSSERSDECQLCCGSSVSNCDRHSKRNRIPCARAGHGGVCIPKFSSDDGDKNNQECRLYIFGGISASGALNDLFYFNTGTLQWTEIIVDGVLPKPRLDFAYCLFGLLHKKVNGNEDNKEVFPSENDHQQYLFIHGGMDTDGNIFDDAWILLLDQTYSDSAITE